MQNEINVKIKKLREGARVPEYATVGSAGCDLRACTDSGEITVMPGERILVPTGIALDPGRGDVVILIFARSSLASKHGISLSNGVGVVDSDYRGEIKVALVNSSDAPFVIRDGDRIAQMAVMPVMRAVFTESDDLGETARADGGFGSTGIN